MSDCVELRKLSSFSDKLQHVIERCDKMESTMQKLVKKVYGPHDDSNKTDAGEFTVDSPLGNANPAFSAPDMNCQQASTDCHIIDTSFTGIKSDDFHLHNISKIRLFYISFLNTFYFCNHKCVWNYTCNMQRILYEIFTLGKRQLYLIG